MGKCGSSAFTERASNPDQSYGHDVLLWSNTKSFILAVAYHFQNDPETIPDMVTAVRKLYDGPVDFAVDGMVWNITKDNIRTRVAMLNSQPFPPPSVVERQQAAPGGEKYETPAWVLQGYEWETLPLMDEIHEEFNEEFGTDFEFVLKPDAE